jgi:predicted transcriptional regulator
MEENVLPDLPSQEYLLKTLEKLRKQIKPPLSLGELGEKALGVPQSTMSKIFSGKRRIEYSEMERLVKFLATYISPLPKNLKARHVAVIDPNLKKAYLDSTVEEVAKILWYSNFTQLPIVEKETGKCVGIITDKSLMEKMGQTTPEELAKLRVMDIKDVVMEVPKYSSETPIYEIYAALKFHYATLIEERGEVKGIITRADFLRFLIEEERKTIFKATTKKSKN